MNAPAQHAAPYDGKSVAPYDGKSIAPYDGRATVLFEHWCEHPACDAWGAFGEGVALKRGIKGKWWCQRHWRQRQAELAAEKQAAISRNHLAHCAKTIPPQAPVRTPEPRRIPKPSRRPADTQQGSLF